MERLSERKIILVTRSTRIDELISRFNTESQARFYIEHLGDDFEDYQKEHETYYSSVKECIILLSKFGRLHKLDRGFLPNYTFGSEDIVVVLGQDGLVANTIKYLNGHPVVGVNPDPRRWDGVLLPFKVEDLKLIMNEVIQNRREFREITMAQVSLNTGTKMYAVNDFFIGPKTHTSARYIIQTNEGTEEQSSSGIIVSTGLGSTGWFKSLLTGATGISTELTGQKVKSKLYSQFTWESDFLCFTVREPFPSSNSQANILHGKIDRSKPLRLVSRMSDHGVIFSDGIEKDYVEFNSGTEATVGVAEKKGKIIQ